MALKYHNAAHSLTAKSDLQNFTNSWLALPWTEHAVKVYDEDLQTCIDNMATRGLVPADYELLIMGIDVGQNQTHYVITALCQGGRLQVIDWGTLVSYKTENGQDGVAAIMDTLSYTNAAGDTIRPDLCLIDSGYDTQGVYEECLRATIGGTIIPVKGSNGSLGAWAKSKIRTMPYAPFELIVYSDYQLKRALYVD